MSTGLMPLIRWSSREVLSTLVLIKVDDFHRLRLWLLKTDSALHQIG